LHCLNFEWLSCGEGNCGFYVHESYDVSEFLAISLLEIISRSHFRGKAFPQ
jgi:hypothetical protein